MGCLIAREIKKLKNNVLVNHSVVDVGVDFQGSLWMNFLPLVQNHVQMEPNCEDKKSYLEQGIFGYSWCAICIHSSFALILRVKYMYEKYFTA